jgi:hypothetical protein
MIPVFTYAVVTTPVLMLAIPETLKLALSIVVTIPVVILAVGVLILPKEPIPL